MWPGSPSRRSSGLDAMARQLLHRRATRHIPEGASPACSPVDVLAPDAWRRFLLDRPVFLRRLFPPRTMPGQATWFGRLPELFPSLEVPRARPASLCCIQMTPQACALRGLIGSLSESALILDHRRGPHSRDDPRLRPTSSCSISRVRPGVPKVTPVTSHRRSGHGHRIPSSAP